MTATYHVLSQPELLREIFSWIDRDDSFSCEVGNDAKDAFLESIDWDKLSSLSEIDWTDCPKTSYYHKKAVLLRCSLVNALWWYEAIRFIWRHLGGPEYPNADLLACFRGFNDHRRKQLHANLVTQADLFLINRDNAGDYNALAQGVIFPNLHRLRLYCPKGRDHIPQLNSPSLKILEIDPQFQCEFGIPEYALSQEQWDEVLPRISVSCGCHSLVIIVPNQKVTTTMQALFPVLDTVKFLDQVRVRQGALAQFEKSLPFLEILDREFVVENTEIETE